jgi:hypothetical protein
VSGWVHSAAAAKDSKPIRDVATRAANCSARIELIRIATNRQIALYPDHGGKKLIPLNGIDLEPISIKTAGAGCRE